MFIICFTGPAITLSKNQELDLCTMQLGLLHTVFLGLQALFRKVAHHRFLTKLKQGCSGKQGLGMWPYTRPGTRTIV